MADNKLLNFQYGQFNKLPAMSADTAGTVFVTTDEKAMYIDLPNKDGALSRVRIGDIVVYKGTSDIEPPYHKGFYYFIDENALMHYDENVKKWERINKEADFSALEGEISALNGALLTLTNTYNTYVTNSTAKFDSLEQAIAARVTTADFETFKTNNTNIINTVSERAEKGVSDAAAAQGTADAAAATASDAGKKATAAQGDIDTWKETHKNDYTNTQITDAIATAKAEAISTAAADATSKANAVEALADAAQLKANNAYDLANTATVAASNADEKAVKAQSDIDTWKNAHKNDYTNSQIDNLISGLNAADAVLEGSINAVKATAEAALPISGTPSGKTMTGAINMGNQKITNLAAPQNDADATNKKYVDDTIAAGIAANDAMTFKGVVDCGQEGGTTNKPADTNANKGDTWKVGRAGTYAGIVAKVGDLLIYNGADGTKVANNWVHVSSGYEDDYLQKLYVANTNEIHLNDGINSSVGGFKIVSGNPDNLLIEVTQGSGTAPIHTITATMVWKSFD